MRRQQRIRNDLKALASLAEARPNFSWGLVGGRIFLQYVDTPGLLRIGHDVEIWHHWRATLLLPPRYPIEPPIVTLSPVGRKGVPWHPNIMPVLPYVVCYGRHLPDLLLDELARRIERMIVLMSFMTDERDSLNPAACAYVRGMSREGRTPLSLSVRTAQELPQGIIGGRQR